MKNEPKTKPQPPALERAQTATQTETSIPSYNELRLKMLEPVPEQMVHIKEKGGREIPFMNITDVVDILDERAGIWRNFVKNEIQIGDQFIITVCIEVLAREGWIAREDVGNEEINLNSYGDTSSNAFAMAFKRAAAKHGVGRELWRKYDYAASEPKRDGERREARQTSSGGFSSTLGTPPPGNPVAKSLSDLITAKQLGLLRGKGKDFNVDYEAFCQKELGCKSDELSKKAASWAIDNIERFAQQPASPNQPAQTKKEAKPVDPTTFSDNAPAPNAGQLKALHFTIEQLFGKGFDESVVIAEFVKVGCQEVSFNNEGSLLYQNLTGERAGAIITAFNGYLKNGFHNE